MKKSLPQILIISLLAIVILNVNCQKLEPVSLTKFSNTKMLAAPASPTTASVTGKFMDVGDGINSYGHCWALTPNPSIADFKSSNLGKPSKQVEFVSQLTGLSPATKYYVKAYAISDEGTIYSGEINFTTLAPPITVTTNAISAITFSSATCGGNVTADVGSIITSRGVCWDIASAPAIALSTKTSNGTGTGIFESNITGLSSGTTYYVRAYATSSFGTVYGNEISFNTTAQSIPTLSTAAIASISQTTATSGGNITNDGGAPVQSRGVCYSTSTNPTILNSVTINGTGAGEFTSPITGLAANTTYYVRAYAINNIGTGYGKEVSFTTSPLLPTVTDIDGNIYHAVVIGTQTWMLENLKTTKYHDGTVISNITDNTTWTNTGAAYCWYNNDVANKAIYGALYNWYAVDPSSNGNKSICPNGWHVPTDAEWIILTNFLGGETFASGKMKEIGTTHWTSPNTEADNSSGFTALPGGSRNYVDGLFNNLGSYGNLWSSIASDASNAWFRYLRYYDAYAVRIDNNKKNGHSVRCLKGITVFLPTLTTTLITSITQTSASSGGNITNDGGASVTARGICYSTSANPTLANSITINGNGNGSFISPMTGLNANTTYYVRAYATTSAGTAYGNEVSFSTNTNSGTTVTDVDGNVYNTVTIGTQVWMKENLKTTKYNDGTLISYITDNTAWTTAGAAYCWYNNDATTYKATYGALYNWYAIDPANNGTKNVCPVGWHVPTDDEWTILITYLGGETVAGGNMKESGTTHWVTPNTGANNSIGFTALAGGYRFDVDGTFVHIDRYCDWWSSNAFGANYAWSYYLWYENTMALRGYAGKQYGASVRCIRD